MSKNKQRVIFVGGTSYSGSTFFHLILANDPHGFACGELMASLQPVRAEHIKRECSCHADACAVWPQVVPNGKQRLYASIFDVVPNTQYIVDSSKSPFWIHEQSAILRRQGIDVSHVLIWKTPEEFGLSRKKRNQKEGWAEEWIRYHKLYFSLIDDFVTVQYRKFTQDQSVLVDTCQKLGLEWFEGKAEYWNREYHALGGNYSARIHLYDGKKAENFLSSGFDEDRMNRHRSIYYLESSDPEIETEMNEGTKPEQFREIIKVLEAQDVSVPQSNKRRQERPQFSKSELVIHRAKNITRTFVGQYKFGRAQRNELLAQLQTQHSI